MCRLKLIEGVSTKEKRKRKKGKGLHKICISTLNAILVVHSWTSLLSKLFASMKNKMGNMRRSYPCAVQGSSNSNIFAFDLRKGFLTLSLEVVSAALLLRRKGCWLFE